MKAKQEAASGVAAVPTAKNTWLLQRGPGPPRNLTSSHAHTTAPGALLTVTEVAVLTKAGSKSQHCPLHMEGISHFHRCGVESENLSVCLSVCPSVSIYMSLYMCACSCAYMYLCVCVCPCCSSGLKHHEYLFLFCVCVGGRRQGFSLA